jgi:hypothetical protein
MKDIRDVTVAFQLKQAVTRVTCQASQASWADVGIMLSHTT